MNVTMHPYYPRDLKIIGYVDNDLSVLDILGWFFGGLLVVMSVFVALLLKNRPESIGRKMAICWLLLSGLIHLILEGHFSLYHADLVSRTDFLSQVCECLLSIFIFIYYYLADYL